MHAPITPLPTDETSPYSIQDPIDRPQIFTFESGKPGPHVAFFGRVHGLEGCGDIALNVVKNALDRGTLQLTSGAVTLVPCANPRAAGANARLVDKDLNRVFKRHAHPTCYEEAVANILCDVVDAADALQDTHSASAKSRPYMFADMNAQEGLDWMRSLSVPHVVTGWDDLYPPEGGESSAENYALHAGKMALTLECGQHDDPSAPVVALAETMNTMRHFGLIAGDKRAPQALIRAHLDKLYRRKDGDIRGPDFPQANFAEVKKGAVLFFNENTGAVKRAPADALAFLPKLHDVPTGTDWLYLAKR